MDDSMRKELGRRFATARKDRGLTQKQVADQAGVSLRTISNLETGRATPHQSNRDAISRVLGQDIFDDGLSDAAREAWPDDVRTYVDVLGQYLSAVPAERRASIVARWIVEVTGAR